LNKVKNVIKKIPGAKPLYTMLRSTYWRVRYVGGRGEYVCPVCGKTVKIFLDVGLNLDSSFPSEVTGLGKRKNAMCPSCGAMERLRLEYIYLTNTDIFTSKCRVLHFAPEPALTNALRKNPSIDYHSGDIQSGCAMHVIDITNICFKNESFDYIICNMVLEHV
jgi:predicted RNA-binding Zn-ribbon protein involved in translation (DUF1610 family)